MVQQKGKSLSDLRNGAVIQMLEGITLGMPFEIWKTRMGRFRNENTIQAFKAVQKAGGGGIRGMSAFWDGWAPKMVESATKGAVLLWSKEAIKNGLLGAGMNDILAGFASGAGGGICQTSVMGPCTFLVTAVVTQKGKNISIMSTMKTTMREKGIKGFYPGGSAIAFRQATNWASRQGFTDAVRYVMRKVYHNGDSKAKLTVKQEVLSGMTGGFLACWNHPFEVARIEMQSRAIANEPRINMVGVFKLVTKEYGVAGLFKGVIPRICLGVWQTLFMVTGADLVKDYLNGPEQMEKIM